MRVHPWRWRPPNSPAAVARTLMPAHAAPAPLVCYEHDDHKDHKQGEHVACERINELIYRCDSGGAGRLHFLEPAPPGRGARRPPRARRVCHSHDSCAAASEGPLNCGDGAWACARGGRSKEKHVWNKPVHKRPSDPVCFDTSHNGQADCMNPCSPARGGSAESHHLAGSPRRPARAGPRAHG